MEAIPHIHREQNERAVRMLSRFLQQLHAACDRFAESRAQMRSLDTERQQDRQVHPEYAEASHRVRMAYWTVIVCAPAVLLLDVLLLNSTAEYLAINLFPEQPKMLLLARLAVPALLFLLECLIAQHVYEAVREHDGISPKAIGWATIGIGLAACAAAAVAFSMAALQAADGDGDAVSPLGWGLCVLAFLMHSSIVFAGRALHDAKGYYSFRQRERSVQRKWRRFEAMHIRSRRDITETFLAYLGQLNLPSMSLNGVAKAGPFSKIVRDTVNDVFGPGTIPAPTPIDRGEDRGGGGTTAPAAVQNPPSAPNVDSKPPQMPDPSFDAQNTSPGVSCHEGDQPVENDYMRQILERIRLERDEEVRTT